MANTERLPTVLYRTPAATSTPLSAGSHYTPSRAFGSPGSPVFSPLSGNTAGYRTSGRTPVLDSTLAKARTPASTSFGGSTFDRQDHQERSVAPRQLYGSGNTAPPPVMSLRDGHGAPRGADPSARGLEAAAGGAGPNPLLANEYAFGAGSASHEADGALGGGDGFRSRWVTVYGFQHQDRDLILRELQECGDIMCCRNGGTERANFMHIQFQSKGEAQRALGKNGKLVSRNLMIGIAPISRQHCMALQQQQKGQQGGVGQSGSAQAYHGNPSPLNGAQGSRKAPTGLGHAGGFDSMPQPVSTFWTKVNEYVFGL